MRVYLKELHILSGEGSRSRPSFKVKRHIGRHCVSQTHLVFFWNWICKRIWHYDLNWYPYKILYAHDVFFVQTLCLFICMRLCVCLLKLSIQTNLMILFSLISLQKPLCTIVFCLFQTLCLCIHTCSCNYLL